MTRPDYIDRPAAWLGADMAAHPDRWRRSWSASEISEIEAAAEAVLASGIEIGQLTAQEFPLPTVGPILSDLRDQLRRGIGFALFTGLPVTDYPLEKACAIFCGVGAHIGSARSQNAMGHVLGHVKDLGADPEDANTRIYQTSARQTFHTDSADVVGLLCLAEAMEGGDSLLVSTLTLYNRMMAEDPDLAAALFEPIATDRRGEVPPGQKPFFEIPVFNWFAGELTGMYQRQYIESAQRFDDAPRLTDRHIAALDLLDSIANDPQVHLKMRLAPGDMQFVYNHTNLHDRTGFRDWPDPSRRRHLLRLWLSLPDDRPLPKVFAQRYGTVEIGNRGGIIVEGTRLNAPLTP